MKKKIIWLILIDNCVFEPPPASAQLAACGNRKAEYIYGEYRFIPIDSTDVIELDSNFVINADVIPYGVITSSNYPGWKENSNFQTTIKTNNPYKAVRIYFTDIDIEDPINNICSKGFLEVDDGVRYIYIINRILFFKVMLFFKLSFKTHINYAV